MDTHEILAEFNSESISGIELDADDMENLRRVFRREESTHLYDFLTTFFDDKIMLFFELFAGEDVKIPEIETIMKYVAMAKMATIYSDLLETHSAEESIAILSEKSGKTKFFIEKNVVPVATRS